MNSIKIVSEEQAEWIHRKLEEEPVINEFLSEALKIHEDFILNYGNLKDTIVVGGINE